MCRQKFINYFFLQQIRVIVKDIEKSARDILMILQNIHNTVYDAVDENISMFLVVYFFQLFFQIIICDIYFNLQL